MEIFWWAISAANGSMTSELASSGHIRTSAPSATRVCAKATERGATLTEQAARLLQAYRAYQADVEAYAKAQFETRFAEFR